MTTWIQIADAIGINPDLEEKRRITVTKNMLCAPEMGLGNTCGRCGGSGRYSYNQIDGSRCYGCNGNGLVVPRPTKALLEAAVAKTAEGALDAVRERATLTTKLRKATDLVYKDWTGSGIGGMYSEAYRQGTLRTKSDLYDMNKKWADLYDHAMVGSGRLSPKTYKGTKAEHAAAVVAFWDDLEAQIAALNEESAEFIKNRG